MISAEYAITKIRRGLTLSAFLRWFLILTAALAVLVSPILDSSSFTAIGILLLVGGIWLALSFRSVRGSRLAADSSSLLASGQFDQAEQQITESVNAFSIFRTVKLMTLHHLAVLRHAQSRWQDSALLCRALLHQRLSPTSSLDRSSRLLLAEALLELGDLPGAYENLMRLYDQRLSLREAMNLLAVQADYMARIGSWDEMMANIMVKIELAELLPAGLSARTQAFFALAAKKTGRMEWADWLRKRVELLVDIQKLSVDRPMLSDVWNN